MAFNFGIAAGAPPRKKSGLPPKVGGKPGLAVMIAAIPKKGGPPKDGDEGPSATGGPLLPRAAGRKSAPPGRAFTAPDEEPDDMLDDDMPDELPGGGGGEDHPILPEAVCYRSEQETCANCVHMQDDGECARLHIPVAHGDGCNLFSDASGGDADESAERFEPEEEGEEEEEN